MPKKKWEKPQLIVLVRGKPEEAVLVTCKVMSPLTPTAYNLIKGVAGCGWIGGYYCGNQCDQASAS